jgi:hypothetical protein
MDWKIFKIILWESIKPVDISWLVICSGLITLIACIIYYRRKSPKNNTGIWKLAGARWKRIGINILIVSIACYGISCVIQNNTKKYNMQYCTFLNNSISINKNIIDAEIMSEEMTLEDIRKYTKDLALKMKNKDRISFRLNPVKNITTPAVKPANWDATRYKDHCDKYEQKDGLKGVATFCTGTTTYIIKDNNDWKEYFKAYDKKQWEKEVNQILKTQNKNEMIKLFASCIKLLDNKEELFNEILDKIYEDSLAEKLAFKTGKKDNYGMFKFFINNIFWIRDLPYLILNIILGVWIMLVGDSIKKKGSRQIFTSIN